MEFDTAINHERIANNDISVDSNLVKDLTRLKGRFEAELFTDLFNVQNSENDPNKYLKMLINNNGAKQKYFENVDIMYFSVCNSNKHRYVPAQI